MNEYSVSDETIKLSINPYDNTLLWHQSMFETMAVKEGKVTYISF